MKSPLSAEIWNRTAWGVALAATLVLFVAVLLPPLLPPVGRATLMEGFHLLCHQIPERSFALGGVSLAVCHRCTGIYLGLVLGVLALPALPLRRIVDKRFEGLVLLVAVVPAAIDWGGDVAGLWTNTVMTRVATGLWFGVLAGYLFARAVSRRPERSGLATAR